MLTKNKSHSLSASLEDYLEAILNIAGESNTARSKDIAESLGVAKSSVTGALKVLAKRGLVNYKPYGYVTLTKSGITEAARVAKKHDVLESFFVDILGVDADTARSAACKAEHALGPAIISRLLDFTDFAGRAESDGPELAKQFRKFHKSRHRDKNRKAQGERRI